MRSLLFAASALVTSSLAAQLSDWQSRSIYQLVTDRFAKTVDDGGPCDTGARQYCGGTWQGIINHLDYIQGMGFDAIWISPVVENIGGNTSYGEAYHGYWPLDFNSLNSNFGSASDLTALSAALHKRGMYLMLDIVINHVAATSIPPNLTYTGYTPYNQNAEYHNFCFISDYNNQTNVEQCWLGDTNVALADLNTEDPDVINGHQAWIKGLVTNYSADGLRIDTAKHIRQDFYPDFLQSAGVFATAEILDDRNNYTGSYTNVIDSVLAYPQFYAMQTAFGSSSGNMSALVENIAEVKQYYKNGAMSTVSFSENQDNPRLPSFIQDPTLVKSAVTFNFVNDGIPVLYYGQEASYSGANDPYNREALWFTSYSESVSLYSYVKNLNAARKLAIADKSGKFLSTAATVVSSTGSNMAFSKYPMLTVLTNGGNSSNAQWTVTNSGYQGGVTLVDVASSSCDTVSVAKDGSIPVTFAAGAPKIYLPATSLSSSSVCGSKASKSAAWPRAAPSGIVGLLAATVAFLALA